MCTAAGCLAGYINVYKAQRTSHSSLHDCVLPRVLQTVAMALSTAILAVYTVMYFFYQVTAFRDHRALPYVQYRTTSLFMRVQVRAVPY